MGFSTMIMICWGHFIVIVSDLDDLFFYVVTIMMLYLMFIVDSFGIVNLVIRYVLSTGIVAFNAGLIRHYTLWWDDSFVTLNFICNTLFFSSPFFVFFISLIYCYCYY